MKHLLVVNIYYAPRSFGGATVVTEEVTKRIIASGEWRVTVLSQSCYGGTDLPAIIRTRLPGDVDHYTINFAGRLPYQEFNNPAMTDTIRKLIAELAPDVAHVHCTQGLGVGMIDALHEANVPTVLSTHDYWWLCEKIFMLNSLGSWCRQEVIDQKVCAKCVHEKTDVYARWEKSLEVLKKPAIISYPSEYSRLQHERNGAPAETGMVLPNGVAMPGPDYPALRKANSSRRLRFGYIGGPGPLKGWAMIERAFKYLDPAKAELVAVDAATHLGRGWWGNYNFGPISEHVTVRPGYTMHTVDEFFSGIDVLLFLSTWKETFGLTSREAALRGVHVIATDCGAPIEHLTDGDTATILKGFGSARSLRKALENLVDNGVPTPSEAGLKKISTMVRSYDDHAAEVMRLFDGLTSSASAAR